jgi:hypothetical protein
MRMNKKIAKKPKVGRPPVEVKKKPFQVMLDPRYIEHFKSVARKKNIQPQDLARLALAAVVPDPYSAALGNKAWLQSIMGEGAK